VTENTDGQAPAAEGAPATPAAQPVTTPPSDTSGRNAEDRIAGLVAERERLKTQLEKAGQEKAALEEQFKTDEQRRIDELVNQRVESEYGPAQQRLERIEAELATKRDKLLETLPEGSRNCYDETAPVEVQVRQIELVASHLSVPGAPAPVDGGGNPPPKETPRGQMFSLEEYQEVQALASSYPAEFDKRWPEMKRALKEGRIQGVNPGGVSVMR
jgi:uncharacterized small protein (DUF1192 family)